MMGGTAVELCSGMGGIGLGAGRLGFDVERAYDSWHEAVEIYNYNSHGRTSKAVECDLVSAAGLRRVTMDKRRIGAVDLVLAGPPCKGFSQLKNGFHDGRIAHNKNNNTVLRAIPHYIGILRPRLFVIENVPALLAHRSGRTFKDVLAHLARPARRLAYRLQWNVYDAANFGTPQSRRRLLLLGVRIDSDSGETLPLPGPNFRPLYAAIRHNRPVPGGLSDYLQVLQDPANCQLVTAEQALSDLPELSAGEPEIPRRYRAPPRSAYQSWIRSGAQKWLSDTQTPAVNTATLDRLFHILPGGSVRNIPQRHLNGLSRKFSSAYRRLHPDAPSTALSTKYDCVYHYRAPRSLSLREYCRLQGNPDFFRFPQELVSRRSAYEMIGNSVPPRLVEGVLGFTLGTAAPRLGRYAAALSRSARKWVLRW